MTEILFKTNDSNQYSWACNVVDHKAKSFVERKNQMFNHGSWKVAQ